MNGSAAGLRKALREAGSLGAWKHTIEAIRGIPLANQIPEEMAVVDLADELAYVYSVIYQGFRFGSFDFSILKKTAQAIAVLEGEERPEGRSTLEGPGETTEPLKADHNTQGEG